MQTAVQELRLSFYLPIPFDLTITRLRRQRCAKVFRDVAFPSIDGNAYRAVDYAAPAWGLHREATLGPCPPWLAIVVASPFPLVSIQPAHPQAQYRTISGNASSERRMQQSGHLFRRLCRQVHTLGF